MLSSKLALHASGQASLYCTGAEGILTAKGIGGWVTHRFYINQCSRSAQQSGHSGEPLGADGGWAGDQIRPGQASGEGGTRFFAARPRAD